MFQDYLGEHPSTWVHPTSPYEEVQFIHAWQEYDREGALFSLPPVGWLAILIYPITDGIHFDLLI